MKQSLSKERILLNNFSSLRPQEINNNFSDLSDDLLKDKQVINKYHEVFFPSFYREISKQKKLIERTYFLEKLLEVHHTSINQFFEIPLNHNLYRFQEANLNLEAFNINVSFILEALNVYLKSLFPGQKDNELSLIRYEKELLSRIIEFTDYYPKFTSLDKESIEILIHRQKRGAILLVIIEDLALRIFSIYGSLRMLLWLKNIELPRSTMSELILKHNLVSILNQHLDSLPPMQRAEFFFNTAYSFLESLVELKYSFDRLPIFYLINGGRYGQQGALEYRKTFSFSHFDILNSEKKRFDLISPTASIEKIPYFDQSMTKSDLVNELISIRAFDFIHRLFKEQYINKNIFTLAYEKIEKKQGVVPLDLQVFFFQYLKGHQVKKKESQELERKKTQLNVISIEQLIKEKAKDEIIVKVQSIPKKDIIKNKNLLMTFAIEEKLDELMKLLIHQGVSFTAMNRNDISVLSLLKDKLDFTSIQFILKHYPKIEAYVLMDFLDQLSLLRDFEGLKWLCSHFPDVRPLGYRALGITCFLGLKEMAYFLIEQGIQYKPWTFDESRIHNIDEVVNTKHIKTTYESYFIAMFFSLKYRYFSFNGNRPQQLGDKKARLETLNMVLKYYPFTKEELAVLASIALLEGDSDFIKPILDLKPFIYTKIRLYGGLAFMSKIAGPNKRILEDYLKIHPEKLISYYD